MATFVILKPAGSPLSLGKATGTLGKAVKCFSSLSEDMFPLGDGIPVLGGQVLWPDPAARVPRPVPSNPGEAGYSPRSGCTGAGVSGHPLLPFPAQDTHFTSSCAAMLPPPSPMGLRAGGCLSKG